MRYLLVDATFWHTRSKILKDDNFMFKTLLLIFFDELLLGQTPLAISALPTEMDA